MVGGTRHRFAIKMSRRVEVFACALCGESAEYDIGPGLYEVNGGERVCRECGREEAPELTALLELADAVEKYVVVIFESADRYSPEDFA